MSFVIAEYQINRSGSAILSDLDKPPTFFVGYGTKQEAESALENLGAKWSDCSYVLTSDDRPGDANMWCIGDRSEDEDKDSRRKFEIFEAKDKSELR